MSLEAEKLCRQFLRKRADSNVFNAVKDVSLRLEAGRVLTVSGRSGSGKTTLLSMLSGLLTPTSGTVKVDGQSLYEMDDRALSDFRGRRFSVVPQGQTAIQSLSVLENVMLPVTMSASRKSERAAAFERARALLEQTGMAELKDAKPSELSGGELRRMALARALANDPDFIFADEPTADLDDENTQRILHLLRAAADHGAAVFIVTHDRDVFDYADENYTMNDGMIGKGVYSV